MTPSSLIRRGGRDAVGTIKASNFSLVRNHCSFSRTARRSKMGMPWSGPRGPLVLRSLARERASSRTWGLTVMIARSPESVGKIRPGTCSSPRQKNRRVFPQIQDRADEYRCGSKRAPFRKVLTKPTPVRKVNSLASGLFTRLTMRKDRRRSGRLCTATGMSPVRQRVTSGKLGHRQMHPGNLVACKNRWASHPKGNRN